MLRLFFPFKFFFSFFFIFFRCFSYSFVFWNVHHRFYIYKYEFFSFFCMQKTIRLYTAHTYDTYREKKKASSSICMMSMVVQDEKSCSMKMLTEQSKRPCADYEAISDVVCFIPFIVPVRTRFLLAATATATAVRLTQKSGTFLFSFFSFFTHTTHIYILCAVQRKRKVFFFLYAIIWQHKER
jgi:hypothetical protein